MAEDLEWGVEYKWARLREGLRAYKLSGTL